MTSSTEASAEVNEAKALDAIRVSRLFVLTDSLLQVSPVLLQLTDRWTDPERPQWLRVGSGVAIGFLPNRINHINHRLKMPYLYRRQVLHCDVGLMSLSDFVE